MTTIKLTVTGAHVTAQADGPLTSGMVGLRVVISYDESWDGLSKTLVCRNSMGNTAFDQVYIVANIGGRATVAPEVMVAQRHLYLGIEGYTREGNLVMPTIWADCGLIQPGAESNGAESQEVTPETWMQLESQIGTLDELIETFALIHLKQYFGKICVLDHEGFYQPLKQLLEHYVQTGMMSKETMDMVVFAKTSDELLDMLED